MKSLIINLLAALGLVFLCLIIAVVYFVITDPYNLKPLLFPTPAASESVTQEARVDDTKVDETPTAEPEAAKTTNEPSGTDTAAVPQSTEKRVEFNLTTAQKQALLNLGVPEASIPTSISYEQEQCFVSVLGESRVNEIKAGAVPGAFEFMRAQGCI